MINKATLVGRLGADPEIRNMGDGSPVANMRLATDESYKNAAGEKVQQTEWHRVVTFGRLAEVAQDYMRKGRLIYVEGKLRTRKWQDQNNIDRYTTEIVASQIRMLDSQPQKTTQAHEPSEAPAGYVPAEDVPF